MKETALQINRETGIRLPGISADDDTPNISRARYPIHAYEVDPRGNLSILAACNFMQDAASRHAADLGISVVQLQDRNVTWVLSRMKVKMHYYPYCRNQVTVVTWPSGADRLFAYRDFYMVDQADHVVGAGISAWLIIDTHSRRPVRTDPFIEKINPLDSGHVLPDKLDKLSRPDAPDYAESFTVRYSDLDINRHVNNVNYIEWALESVPREIKEAGVISELEINFLGEAVLGDRITAACGAEHEKQDIFQHTMVRDRDGLEVARARTVWTNWECLSGTRGK